MSRTAGSPVTGQDGLFMMVFLMLFLRPQRPELISDRTIEHRFEPGENPACSCRLKRPMIPRDRHGQLSVIVQRAIAIGDEARPYRARLQHLDTRFWDRRHPECS